MAARSNWLALILAGACSGCAAHGRAESEAASRPSCQGLGADACQGHGCCASLPVPAQTFTLGGTVESMTARASVSSFQLDEYEVTVARFRAFVADYDAWRAAGNPIIGAGAHPLIEGSGFRDPSKLPASAAVLASEGGVACTALNQTYLAGRDDVPVNCVTWLEAFAFCIWDGGRLPTEAEWEAAATAGDAGSPFPWGDGQPDSNRAAYDCTGDGSIAQDCTIDDILVVGSKPAGNGRWGHADLAGNVWEWVLDTYQTFPPIATDYANVSDTAYRTIRGSGWYSNADDLRSAIRYNSAPEARRSEFGFRCAGAR